MACVTVFPSDIVISTRLPDSASIFTAEVWAIIKALEQIRDSGRKEGNVLFNDTLNTFYLRFIWRQTYG